MSKEAPIYTQKYYYLENALTNYGIIGFDDICFNYLSSKRKLFQIENKQRLVFTETKVDIFNIIHNTENFAWLAV